MYDFYHAEKVVRKCSYKTGQRLGQALVNYMNITDNKNVHDPELFYEEDNQRAARLFYTKYVSQN